MKTILKRLITAGILTENPAREIKPLTENERNFHILGAEEEKIYLSACPQPLQDVTALMIETGPRPAAIYGLKRESISVKKGFLQNENSKTKASNRKVWLSDKAAELLQKDERNFLACISFQKVTKTERYRRIN